jgi:hypothetical protein
MPRRIAIGLFAFVAGLGAQAAERAPQNIFRTESPPVIDGKLDDDCWRRATVAQVQYPFGEPGTTTSPPPMTARFLWDEHFLYVGYLVRDENLVAIGTGKEVGPPTNRRPTSEEYLPDRNLDLVEFFVSFRGEQEFWELHHTAANHLNNHWCEVPDYALKPGAKPTIADVTIRRDRFASDDGAHTVARAAALSAKADGSVSTVNEPADRDTGYSGELRFPWAGLGAPADRREADGKYAMAGLQLKILAAVLNGNGGKAVYHSSARDLPARMFHFSAARWPRYVLSDE